MLHIFIAGNNKDSIRRLSMIVRVNVVLNRSEWDCFVDSDWRFDITCAVVIFRVKVSCITSVV